MPTRRTRPLLLLPRLGPFKATKCKPLGFKPKLHLRLYGATKRAQHPKLRAILQTRPKDADISRASVGLPHALFLDQASLSKICTRVQFAADACPKKSVYGHATATTPLLGKPLKGPVYLRSSSNPLPDLVAHLKGQVDIDLVGQIDSFRGGIRTTFDRVPDVPVTKFTMVLPGGKHGLLVASTNLCTQPVKGIVRLKGPERQEGQPAPSCGRLRRQEEPRKQAASTASGKRWLRARSRICCNAHLIRAPKRANVFVAALGEVARRHAGAVFLLNRDTEEELNG